MKDDDTTMLQIIALIAVIVFLGYKEIHDHVDPPQWVLFLFISFAFIGKKVSNVILKVLERLVGK